MPKFFITLLLLSVVAIIAWPVKILASSHVLTISPQFTDLTTRDGIKVGYIIPSTDFNASGKNCLVAYLKREGAFVKSSGSSLGQKCYNDIQSIFSFEPAIASSGFALDPQPNGNYELMVKLYKESCTIGSIGCKWDLKKTSNALQFSTDKPTTPANASLNLDIKPSSGASTDSFMAEVKLTKSDGTPISNTAITLKNINSNTSIRGGLTSPSGELNVDISAHTKDLQKGSYTIEASTIVDEKLINQSTVLTITQDKRSSPAGGTGGSVASGCTSNCTTAAGQVCDSINFSFAKDGSGNFIKDKEGNKIPAEGAGGGIYTAIGCIPTEPGRFIQGFIKLATGVGGTIALLLMVGAAFQMITSAGNPDNLKKGQEQFTSAIVGLLVVIFSVLLMEIIGVDILGLDQILGPSSGFGK